MNIQFLKFKHPLARSHGTYMNLGLWAGQVLLALVFGLAGGMKLLSSMADLSMSMPWTMDVSGIFVRFIGICELAGAAGILLPALTRIRPQLTSVAALCLAALMLFALIFHMFRGEYANLPLPLALCAMANFVAWGRAYWEPLDAVSNQKP